MVAAAAILLAGASALLGRAALSTRASPADPGAHPTPSHLQLASLVADLPQRLRDGILARPDLFLDHIRGVLQEPEGLLTLVDKTHPLGNDYVPKDLVRLSVYAIAASRADLELRRVVIPDLLDMIAAAGREGVRLVVASAYRSYGYQADVFGREVAVYGREVAESESAQPGRSQHQLGTAIDFAPISDVFARSPASAWLAEHARAYGFSLSYPQDYEALTGYRYEAWHYRYIGHAAADLEQEFFGGVQQYLLQFLDWNQAALRRALDEEPASRKVR